VQGRDPAAFADHDRIYAVSGWVRDGLKAAGLPVWEEPLYGVADVGSRKGSDGAQSICRTSRYDWDRRKGRDRLLGAIEPLAEMLRPHPAFERRPGLTLGIVSRLTPIKQFPPLFAQLAPVLARQPRVNLEIFGSGGYASVRDLDRALAVLPGGQARFWGQQRDVGVIYGQLDYLLSGLPEKEALGLNIIEAQACGTPVIAVNAPPFTETVLNGETGFLYRDPRQDAGADFARLIDELLAGRARPKPELARQHLARFSFDAFVERMRPIVADTVAYTSRE
jgi:glycosyltransferase involved in cell wall biosynthesis